MATGPGGGAAPGGGAVSAGPLAARGDPGRGRARLSGRGAGGRVEAGGGRRALQAAHPPVHVLEQVLLALAQALDLVALELDLAAQLAHLALEALHGLVHLQQRAARQRALDACEPGLDLARVRHRSLGTGVDGHQRQGDGGRRGTDSRAHWRQRLR